MAFVRVLRSQPLRRHSQRRLFDLRLKKELARRDEASLAETDELVETCEHNNIISDRRLRGVLVTLRIVEVILVPHFPLIPCYLNGQKIE